MPSPFLRRRSLLLTATVAGTLIATPCLAAGPTLLNVSYDVSREFYKDDNQVFATHWKTLTGETLTLNQSHGGSR